MPPYSRRPPAIDPHPLPLGTGDFEAVSYNEQYGPPSVRPPPMSRSPMQPVFHQQPPRSHRTGYGAFGGNQPAPAAPNSLSPVAMAANGYGPGHSANGTGPQRAQAQETFVIRARPNMRTGFSILLAGALIGSVIGITARARQNAADAAFAANHQVVSDPPAPTTPLPNILQQPTSPTPATTPPPVVASNSSNSKDSKADKDKDKDNTKKPAGHFSWGGGGGKAAPHVFAGNAKSAAEGPKEKDPPAASSGKGGGKGGKGGDDDGYTVASADNGKEAKEAAAREAKEKAAAAKEKDKDKDDTRTASSSSSSSKDKDKDADSGGGKKSGGGGKKSNKDDADAVLKAAMGATANTL